MKVVLDSGSAPVEITCLTINGVRVRVAAGSKYEALFWSVLHLEDSRAPASARGPDGYRVKTFYLSPSAYAHSLPPHQRAELLAGESVAAWRRRRAELVAEITAGAAGR